MNQLAHWCQRGAAVELWLVGPAVAATILTDRALLPAVLLAAVFWGIHWCGYGYPRRRTPADLPIAVLVLLLPLTLAISPQPEITHTQVLRLLAGIALYYSITTWTTRLPRLHLLLLGLTVGAVGLALSALVTIDWQAAKLSLLPTWVYQRQPFVLGDDANPNVLAGQLALLLPLVLAPLYLAGSTPRRVQLGSLLAASIGITILILSESRGGIVAASMALLTMGIIVSRHRILLGSSLLFVVVLFWLLGGVQAVLTSEALGGIEGRLEIWQRAAWMIQDFAFTGVGMGAFLAAVETLYPYTIVPPGRGEHAHNLLMQVAVDLGLVGLLAWLAVLLLCTVAAWRAYVGGRAMGSTAIAVGGLGVLGSQVALLNHGMVDAVTWGMVKPAPLVWAVWGLGCAAAALAQPAPAPSD